MIKNKRVVGAPGATPANYCHGIKAEVTPVSVPLCLLEHRASFSPSSFPVCSSAETFCSVCGMVGGEGMAHSVSTCR